MEDMIGLVTWQLAAVNAVTDKGGPFTDIDPSLILYKRSRCYKANDNSYIDTNWGYRFNFGGRGGNVKVCVAR